MIRVLYFITGLEAGGAERNLFLLLKYIERERIDPRVVSLSAKGIYGPLLDDAGVAVETLGGSSSFSAISVLRGAARAARRFSPEICHGFMFHGGMAARWAAIKSGARCVSSLRVAEREKRWHLLLDGKTKRWVDLYTANSNYLAEFASRKLGIDRTGIEVIPNSYERPEVSKREARAELGLPDDAFVVGTVARLHLQKDPRLWLEVASNVTKRRDNILFVWIGSGPEEGEARRAAGEMGLTGRVVFTGLLGGGDRLAAAFDLGLLTSRWEGLPNAAIEAMGLGIPMITTPFGGAGEIVEDGKTGFIRPDAEGISSAMEVLIDDPALRLGMGRAARAFVEEEFDPRGVAEAYTRLYERIIS